MTPKLFQERRFLCTALRGVASPVSFSPPSTSKWKNRSQTLCVSVFGGGGGKRGRGNRDGVIMNAEAHSHWGAHRNNCLTIKCVCSLVYLLELMSQDIERQLPENPAMKWCSYFFSQPAEWRLARKGGWKLGAHSESLAVTHSFCINATGCGDPGRAGVLINWIFSALCSVNAHLSARSSFFSLFSFWRLWGWWALHPWETVATADRAIPAPPWSWTELKECHPLLRV